jgi:gas vesicle protein
MARKKGFLAGAAIGAAIAGGLALLFAPKAGSELRSNIAKKANDLSKDLDLKIAKAKKEALKLKGEAKTNRLKAIGRAENIKKTLEDKSHEFGVSGKKVTKVAAREADKLIQEGKVLLSELDAQGSIAYKDAKKYAKKAGKSAQKVAKAAKKELKSNKAKS